MERWENGCICSCSYRCLCSRLFLCFCLCFCLVFAVLKPMPIRRLPRRPFEKLLLQLQRPRQGGAGGEWGLVCLGFLYLICVSILNAKQTNCQFAAALNAVASTQLPPRWFGLQQDASTARPLDASGPCNWIEEVEGHGNELLLHLNDHCCCPCCLLLSARLVIFSCHCCRCGTSLRLVILFMGFVQVQPSKCQVAAISLSPSIEWAQCVGNGRVCSMTCLRRSLRCFSHPQLTNEMRKVFKKHGILGYSSILSVPSDVWQTFLWLIVIALYSACGIWLGRNFKS